MQTDSRRSFVRKSIATTISFSFAGLIRAHGEEGGGTTNTTAWETTVGSTIATTFDPWGTTYVTTTTDTTTDPFETTCETTHETTAQTTAEVWLQRKWDCKRTLTEGKDDAYSAAQLASLYQGFTENNPNFETTPIPDIPSGSIYISGPHVVESGNLQEPSVTWGDRENIRCEDWVDPATNKHYAIIRYDFVQYRYYSNGEP